jgi:hypothetical protein
MWPRGNKPELFPRNFDFFADKPANSPNSPLPAVSAEVGFRFKARLNVIEVPALLPTPNNNAVSTAKMTTREFA